MSSIDVKKYYPTLGIYAYFKNLPEDPEPERRKLGQTALSYFLNTDLPEATLPPIEDVQQNFLILAKQELEKEKKVLKLILPKEFDIDQQLDGENFEGTYRIMTELFSEYYATKEYLEAHTKWLESQSPNISEQLLAILKEIWDFNEDELKNGVNKYIDLNYLAEIIDNETEVRKYTEHIFILAFQLLINQNLDLFSSLEIGSLMTYTIDDYKTDFDTFKKRLPTKTKRMIEEMGSRIGGTRLTEKRKESTNTAAKNFVREMAINFNKKNSQITVKTKSKDYLENTVINQAGFFIEKLLTDLGLKNLRLNLSGKDLKIMRTALPDNKVTTDIYGVITASSRATSFLAPMYKKLKQIAGDNKKEGREATLKVFKDMEKEFDKDPQNIFVIAESSKYISYSSDSTIGGGARALQHMDDTLQLAFPKVQNIKRIIQHVGHYSPSLLLGDINMGADKIIVSLMQFLINEIPLLFFDDFQREGTNLINQKIPVIHLMAISGFRIPFSLFLYSFYRALEFKSYDKLLKQAKVSVKQGQEEKSAVIKLGSTTIGLKVSNIKYMKGAWESYEKEILSNPVVYTSYWRDVQKILMELLAKNLKYAPTFFPK